MFGAVMIGTGTIYSINDALRECGVTETTLTVEEKEALDKDGYTVLTDIIDAQWLDRLRDAFEKLHSEDHQTLSIQPSGTRHVNDLIGRDAAFDGVCAQSRVLAAVYHMLGCPFRLSQAGGRDPLQGYGQQGLHADWMARAPGEPFRVATAIWLLDDFTPTNGATRLVPGTHQLLSPPPKSMADPSSHHPEEKIVAAAAGSVLVFNGHLWHSGTRNQTALRRRVLQCVFKAREMSASLTINPDALQRLTPAARYILGA
jgi:ectoine hydroxylase-related dioxygenase (phytanoyl-CoA dioxygenase family)